MDGFTIVPNDVLCDTSIGHGAFRLYVLLCAHDWRGEEGRKGRVWPSQKTLAKALGTNERTIMRWLAELQKRGYITQSRRGRHNVYTLNHLSPPAKAAPREREEAESEGLSEAVRVYYELTKQKHIPRTSARAIDETVKDLALWQETVTAWIERGYNPRNIPGILDWYRNPSRPDGKGNGKSAAVDDKFIEFCEDAYALGVETAIEVDDGVYIIKKEQGEKKWYLVPRGHAEYKLWKKFAEAHRGDWK